MTSTVKLRAATWDDFDFLYHLHRAALKDYVAQTWGWDEAWQQDYFLQHFNPPLFQIIVFQGQDIGVLSVIRREDEICLGLIEILPEYQRRGIGTQLVESLIDEAHCSGEPIGLQVLKVNPVRRLYERLGFFIVGETATHYLMKAKPQDETVF
jgi:ribosomal protein S18 acetylase RimI-like enzyme